MNYPKECPRCRSAHISKAGYRFSNLGKTARQRYRCLDCQKWFLAEYIENPKPPKKKIDLKDFKYKNQEWATQNWTAYTQAQNNEKRVLQNILKELLEKVEIKVTDRKLGRKYLDMKDMCFALGLKTYTKLSSRRLNSDLEKAKHEEYISKAPHFTTLMNWLEKEEMTQLLLELIKLSALPVKPIESQYAIDSSGFSSSQFGRWFNFKYGEEKICRNWVKAHIMAGTKTNIVTSVELTKAYGGDSPKLQPLVEKTCENFDVKEVSADKAYSSRKNLQIIVDHGAIPYIPFKSNTKSRAFGVGVWKKMHYYFKQKPQEFYEHYHKRSNVETTFAMIKQKFSGQLLTKNWQANTNEILGKCICHNIYCLIKAYYLLNVEKTISTEVLNRSRIEVLV